MQFQGGKRTSACEQESLYSRIKKQFNNLGEDLYLVVEQFEMVSRKVAESMDGNKPAEMVQDSTDPRSSQTSGGGKALPQKKYYRQRAHSNPICDHVFDYPTTPEEMNWNTLYPPSKLTNSRRVEFLDIGCGYGGLLVALSKMFPEKLMLGLEIRVKVQQYVQYRIEGLRKMYTGHYENIAVLRTNAMKYLPNYFHEGQIEKMFFLYPDPHFKKSKYKWRIINDTLLSEYAYILAKNAKVYTVTDVKDLHDWMVQHFTDHQLFEPVSDAEMESDPVSKIILDSTEEGKKVTRNKGDKYIKIFRRIDPK